MVADNFLLVRDRCLEYFSLQRQCSVNVIVPQTHNAGKVIFDCLVISQVKSLSCRDKWRSVVFHVWVDSEQKCVTPTGTTRMLKLCAGNLDYHMVGTQDAESDNSNSVQKHNHDYIDLHCIHCNNAIVNLSILFVI